tara:strand:- start:513 stop:746 length:234 start_codon:yes stop_codon:yes gene_type:complete
MALGRSSFFIIILTVIITSISSLNANDDILLNSLETDEWFYDIDKENGLVGMMRNGKITHGDKILFLIEIKNLLEFT